MSIDHETALELSPTYKQLTPGQKAFAIAWMSDGDTLSLANISRQIGCTYTKAKQWRKSQPVMMACREIALQHASIADTALLVAHELVALDLLQRIRDGKVNSENIRNEQLRILEGAQRRTGLDNLVTFVLNQDKDGQSASLTGELNVVGQALAQLKASKNPPAG